MVVAALGAGCESQVALHAFFDDELVEAPTRSLSLAGVRGLDCEGVLSRPHDDLGGAGEVAGRWFGRYPVHPEEPVFADFPTGERLALDVAALDASFLQVGRACVPLTLDGVVDQVDVQLLALPRCKTAPQGLDVMLVIDTSLSAEVADPGHAAIAALGEILLQPGAMPAGTMWGVVTFGSGDRAAELQSLTADVDHVRGVVESLGASYSGSSRLYDGISKGAELLRARALCGRKPALLVIASTADEDSERRFFDAGLAIFASREVQDDDLFTFAIGLSVEAYDELDEIVPQTAGTVTAAAPGVQLRFAVQEARDALRGALGAP